MSEPVIDTRGLVRRFGRKTAVDGIDLTVQSGGIVAVVGPNGAGKTTLFHLLLGLLEPTAGESRVLGCNSRSLSAEVAATVLAVGDRHEPPGSMRIDQLFALQSAATPQFDARFAQQLLLDRGLDANARYRSLSKGQRRWVLATIVLAARPRLLVMDEPADGLDPSARHKLYDLLRRHVNESGGTVLVASHVLSDLERVADEVIVLREGRVVLHDSLEALRDETRELNLGAGEPSPDWLVEFDILSESAAGAVRTQWIRVRAGRAAALGMADDHPAVRHVNLESLYHALTNNGLARSASTAQSEVLPCN